jgi:hypothetical protein
MSSPVPYETQSEELRASEEPDEAGSRRLQGERPRSMVEIQCGGKQSERISLCKPDIIRLTVRILRVAFHFGNLSDVPVVPFQTSPSP